METFLQPAVATGLFLQSQLFSFGGLQSEFYRGQMEDLCGLSDHIFILIAFSFNFGDNLVTFEYNQPPEYTAMTVCAVYRSTIR